MFWQYKMDVEDYLDFCKERNVFPRFRGVKPFRELQKRGRITPLVTSIRVMYTGLIDEHYYVDENQMLLSINHPEEEPQKPEEVLDEKKHPDGWEIEMVKPKHFRE